MKSYAFPPLEGTTYLKDMWAKFALQNDPDMPEQTAWAMFFGYLTACHDVAKIFGRAEAERPGLGPEFIDQLAKDFEAAQTWLLRNAKKAAEQN